MASLTDRLRDRIRSAGPISFHDFMAAALYDEKAGYYSRDRQRWGRTGDYRTSPERSVLFAATFAGYFSDLYRRLGSPAEWILLEGGAGSGEFAQGVLETLRLRAPEVLRATHYVIDERSHASREIATERLTHFGPQVEFARMTDLPRIATGVIFSNELLDAFPVHRVAMRDGSLAEFFVTTTDTGEFDWYLREPSTPLLRDYFANANVQLVEGQIAEVNLAIGDWIALSADKLERGFVITVDYGSEAPALYSPTLHPLGTLRSYKNHRLLEHVLANPGEQDITSSVNWSDVIKAGEAAGLRQVEFARQDQFLLQAGLLDELQRRVDKSTSEAEKLSLSTSAREMILPNGMAASFQVLVQEK